MRKLAALGVSAVLLWRNAVVPWYGILSARNIIYAASKPSTLAHTVSVLSAYAFNSAFPCTCAAFGTCLLQVYALYAALLLTAFNRLPLRLPSRGPLAGRKHNKGGENSTTPVMFADVAGVDEAKEELQEIVVSMQLPDMCLPACWIILCVGRHC